MAEQNVDSKQFNEDTFKHIFTKLVVKLRSLEDYKHLPPKFSCAYEELLNFYDIDLDEA